jgi:hypothetical protein
MYFDGFKHHGGVGVGILIRNGKGLEGPTQLCTKKL